MFENSKHPIIGLHNARIYDVIFFHKTCNERFKTCLKLTTIIPCIQSRVGQIENSLRFLYVYLHMIEVIKSVIKGTS